MKSAFITNIAAFLPNAPVSNDEMEAVLGMVAGKPSHDDWFCVPEGLANRAQIAVAPSGALARS